jgi:hypothetical protein
MVNKDDKKQSRQEQKWISAHEIADMLLDCAYKQVLLLFVLERTQSEVRLNDLINEAQEKGKQRWEHTIDIVIDLLEMNGIDLYED